MATSKNIAELRLLRRSRNNKVGPYTLGRVHHADCAEAMQAIPDGAIPLIWTDPPYGHNNNDGDLIHKWEVAFGRTEDGEEEDARPILNDSTAERNDIVRIMLAEAGRILSKDSSAICCCCSGGGGSNPLFARAALEMDKAPLEFCQAVVWDKGGLGMGWKYRRNYEFILVAKRKGGKMRWCPNEKGVNTGNIVRIPKILPRADQHPTVKPVSLVEHFLHLHTKPGDLVLDPFAGSGTTGVACARSGRRFLGFELDKHWVDVANQRIEAACKGEEKP